MGKLTTFVLSAALLLCATDLCAQNKDQVPDETFFSLYKTAGRSWAWKRTPKAGQEGGDMDIYMARTEVKSVYSDYAELETQNLDERGREMDNSPPQTVKVKFDRDSSMFKSIGFTKQKDEWVKVKAGKFFCRKFVSGDGGSFLWKSLKYRGLMVKSDDRFGSRELIEFEEFKDDPEYTPPGKAPKKPKKPKKDKEPNNLFREKVEWTVKVTRKPTKGAATITHLHYEFESVDKEKAVLVVTKLTQHRKKIKGEEPERIEIPVGEIDRWYEPRERAVEDRLERRQVEGGVHSTKVWTYKDADGNAVVAWYSEDWKGLEVRRVETHEDATIEYELVELED